MRIIVIPFINIFLCGNHFWTLKRLLLRFVCVKVGRQTKIVGPISIGICADLIIGDNTWVGKDLFVYGNSSVYIGSNCDIAPNVSFATGSHEIGGLDRRAGTGYCEPIKIGNGTWIGLRSIVLAGVNIGNGVIVGAGAVVTKSFNDNVMIAGVPAIVKKELD